MKATRFLLVFGDSAVLLTAKNCQSLDEYSFSETTVGDAMGYDVLETITILKYHYMLFLVENSIVSEQEMVDHPHRKL